jgi:hypothetical protein
MSRVSEKVFTHEVFYSALYANAGHWRFELLIPVNSHQLGAFVNPRTATLTRSSSGLSDQCKLPTNAQRNSHVPLTRRAMN